MFFMRIWGHMKILLHQKGAFICFWIAFIFVIINFLSNVWTYKGYDIVDMYHPMKLLLLCEDSGATRYYFLQVFPFLVVLPGGFSMLRDQQTGMRIFYTSKSGRKKYFAEKSIAVFGVSFAVFAIPLLLEVVLNVFSFPLPATGDLTNMHAYDPVYIELTGNYLFSEFFVYAPYLYTVLMILLISVMAGILGLFSAAISLLGIKYKIFLFIPIYLILNGLTVIANFAGNLSFSVNYFDYLSLFECSPKNEIVYLGFGFIILIISIVIIAFKAKRDCI